MKIKYLKNCANDVTSLDNSIFRKNIEIAETVFMLKKKKVIYGFICYSIILTVADVITHLLFLH